MAGNLGLKKITLQVGQNHPGHIYSGTTLKYGAELFVHARAAVDRTGPDEK